MYTQEEFYALKARVAAMEAGLNAVIAKMEDDVANNSGALTTGYDASLSDAAVQYTITNLRNYGIKFTDLKGEEYFLGKAGGSNASVVVFGQSPDVLALLANSDITSVAV